MAIEDRGHALTPGRVDERLHHLCGRKLAQGNILVAPIAASECAPPDDAPVVDCEERLRPEVDFKPRRLPHHLRYGPDA